MNTSEYAIDQLSYLTLFLFKFAKKECMYVCVCMFSKVMGEGQAWSLENGDTDSFSFDSHNSKKVIFMLSARIFFRSTGYHN